MATAGATMHHPFTVPPWVEKTEYTKTEWTNNYLNVVKRVSCGYMSFHALKLAQVLPADLVMVPLVDFPCGFFRSSS